MKNRSETMTVESGMNEWMTDNDLMIWSVLVDHISFFSPLGGFKDKGHGEQGIKSVTVTASVRKRKKTYLLLS